MYPPVSTKDPTAVEVEVQRAYLTLFPEGDRLFVPRVFGWGIECFTGNYKDYQAVDARYHDFEHTLQGTLCMARLLKGRFLAGARPELTERAFRLGLLAITIGLGGAFYAARMTTVPLSCIGLIATPAVLAGTVAVVRPQLGRALMLLLR